MNGKHSIRKIVFTALLVSLAMVIRNFSYMVFFGGAPGMRIGFSGVFTKMAAVLFGPLFGGIASGLVDIFGFIINPLGPYIPWLTVTSVSGGVITGFLWILFGNFNDGKLQKSFLVFLIIIGAIGAVNHIHIAFIKSSFWTGLLNSIGKYRDFTSVGLEAASFIGLCFILVDLVIKRLHPNSKIHTDFLKILLSTGISGIIITTLNTYILQSFIPGLGKMGFLAFWIPRGVQEIVMVIIQAYIVSILLSVYRKYFLKG